MRRGMHIGYWWESQKERDQREDQDVGGWAILKTDLGEIGWEGVIWIELIWLRIGVSEGVV
jgi:hypothetical protein